MAHLVCACVGGGRMWMFCFVFCWLWLFSNWTWFNFFIKRIIDPGLGLYRWGPLNMLTASWLHCFLMPENNYCIGSFSWLYHIIVTPICQIPRVMRFLCYDTGTSLGIITHVRAMWLPHHWCSGFSRLVISTRNVQRKWLVLVTDHADGQPIDFFRILYNVKVPAFNYR